MSVEVKDKVGTPFELALEKHFEVAKRVEAAISKGGNKPAWAISLDKLHSVFIKCREKGICNDMKDMFQRFAVKYSKEVCTRIFTNDENDDVDVNDEFFKSKDVFPYPGYNEKKKKSKTTSWLQPTIHKGPVVYYDNSVERKSVCLPIGHCYTAAISLLKQNSDIPKYKVLPARILATFYRVIYESSTNSKLDLEVIEDNIKLLESFIDSNTTTEEGDDSDESDDPFSSIGNIFKKFVGDKDGDLKGMFNNVLKSEGASRITNTVSNMMGRISEKTGGTEIKDPKDVGKVLNAVLDEAKSDEVVGMFQDLTGKIMEMKGESTTTKVPEDVICPKDADPTQQE